MKKSITRIMLIALATILTASLAFGLAGCGPKGPEGFATAEAAWNNATGTKKAVDEISATVVINLGEKIGEEVTLLVEGKITREYKGSELTGIEGELSKISLSNLSDNISGVLTSISGFGITLPEAVQGVIDDLVDTGSLTLEDLASGSIEVDDDVYYIEGEVTIDLFDLNIHTQVDGVDGAIEVPAADVEDGIEDLGLEDIALDMLTLYQVESGNVGKDNTVSFSGEAGLDYLITAALDVLDDLLGDGLVFGEETIEVPAFVLDIIEDFAGSSDIDDIKDFLIGDGGLVDLGTVNLSVTYEGEKFATISGTQTISASVSKTAVVDKALAIELPSDDATEVTATLSSGKFTSATQYTAGEILLIGGHYYWVSTSVAKSGQYETTVVLNTIGNMELMAGMDVDMIVNSLAYPILKLPTTITASVTVSFTTTYTY